MHVPAYIKHLVLTLLFIVAAVNFTRTTLNIIESSKRLDELKNTVSSLESKKNELKSELEYKKTDDFVEKEARNKLGMAKIGEEIFVVENILGTNSALGQSKKALSNVQLWVQVFSRGFDNIDNP
ncbi:septum formation initiator family protein [candidate division WWE3 bacterium]|nr:septum formation initiator family protein [candidate division WWE3 bacterium]